MILLSIQTTFVVGLPPLDFVSTGALHFHITKFSDRVLYVAVVIEWDGQVEKMSCIAIIVGFCFSHYRMCSFCWDQIKILLERQTHILKILVYFLRAALSMSDGQLLY